MASNPRPDSNEEIGRRLRLIRLAYGALQDPLHPMSQAEFCRLCEIGRAAWNNAETGDVRIGLDNANAVRRRTGAGLNYIYHAEIRDLPHALAIEIARLEKAEEKAKATSKRA
jgi:transcriptional regulator with XRE-family HTH domain